MVMTFEKYDNIFYLSKLFMLEIKKTVLKENILTIGL